MKYRTILLFGAPGAGKGTQGRILGAIPNFFYCACGDVFRSLSIESETGRIFVEYSSRGKLVPDKPTVRMWRDFIANNTQTGRFQPRKDTLVLDGIPRNLHQAEMLDRTLNVVGIFYLRSRNQKMLIERLQRRALKENRLDDANLEIIRHRMKVYEQETRPVLDFYGQKLVRRINSDQPPAKVLLDILRQIIKV